MRPHAQTKDIGYIYAIGMDGSQLIKIGCTYDSARNRASTFQTGTPQKLEVLQEIRVEYPRAIERLIHDFLAGQRVNGEWFRFNHINLPALVTQAVQAFQATQRPVVTTGTRRFTLRIPRSLVNQLEAMVNQQQMRIGDLGSATMTNLVRDALRHYLECDAVKRANQ